MVDLIGTDETWGSIRGKLNRALGTSKLSDRPTRTRIVMCGHSFGQNENFAVSDGGLPTVGNRMEGMYEWARALSLGILPPLAASDVLAVGGSQSTAHVTQIQTALTMLGSSSKLAIIVCPTGTNDMGTITSANLLKTNVQTIIELVSTSGALLVLETIIPRGVHSLSSRRRANSYNNWLRNYAKDKSWVILVDVAPLFVDFATSNGDPIGGNGNSEAVNTDLTLLYYDQTHPSPRGGYVRGKALWSAIQPYVGPYVPWLSTPADTWDANDNPTGVINSSGALIGTGGGVTNMQSGSIAPNGYNITLSDTPTAIATSSKTTVMPQGLTGEGLRIVLSAGGTGLGSMRIYEEVAVDTTKMPVGSIISGADLIRFTKTTGLVEVSTQIIDYPGGTQNNKVASMLGSIRGTGGFRMPVMNGVDVCGETPKMTVSGTSTKVRFQTLILFDMATVDADITIAARALRLVS